MFRATYCAISVAAALNLLTDDLLANAVEYIARYSLQPVFTADTVSCQTYEGGLGGEPFNEAHGGYLFRKLSFSDFSSGTRFVVWLPYQS